MPPSSTFTRRCQLTLFNFVVENAIGEPLDTLMDKCGAAIQRGDFERVRLIDVMVSAATVLGTHAVLTARIERTNH